MNSETSSPSQTRRILIIESDTASADRLANLLEEDGHTFHIAVDAKTALLMLNEFNPHLVLLGTYLADMPGYELTVILRDAPQFSGRFRKVALLFVAERDKIVKHRMFGAPDIPMSQYIFKPIDPSEVREKIARELAKYESQNTETI
jgi:PleD family two-component response regulator